MNNFEQFLTEKLIEAHSPERHREEWRQAELDRKLERDEQGRKEFERSGGPPSKPYAGNPDAKKDDEWHEKLLDKADETGKLRAKRLKKQFTLKQRLKYGPPSKEKNSRISRQYDTRIERLKSGSRGHGGRDESEFAQDHLDRPW